MRTLSILSAAVVSALVPSNARWGEAGHRIIGQLAAEALPAEMPAFFRNASARLSYLNPEPDRWRDGVERRMDPALDQAFYADHFIDLDAIPADRRAAVFHATSRYAYIDSLRAIGLEPTKIGFSPYAMLEQLQRLRSEFRRWRAEKDPGVRAWIEERIIDDAGVVGHFIADASNPAHVTLHYNGWVGPNPNGYATDSDFHSRFENAFVSANIRAEDVRPLVTAAPQVFPDFRSAIGRYIQGSLDLVEPMYQMDKRARFDANNTSAEAKRFVVQRLAVGAVMLRDFWFTAWETSK